MVVASQDELLTRLDGRVVRLASGASITLATLGREPTPVVPTLWERLRLALADPTVAFVLLVIGALAIYLEIAVPGTTIFAGIGIVLIAGAAMGLLVLPIRWWSLLLLLLALGLIGVRVLYATHGALAVTGLALVVVSALTLIDPAQAPDTAIAIWVVAVMVLALATFAALGIWLVVRSHARPVATGKEAMIGRLAQGAPAPRPAGHGVCGGRAAGRRSARMARWRPAIGCA